MPGAVALLKSTPRVTRSEKRRPAGSQAVRACDKRHKPRHKPLPPVKAVADEVHTLTCNYYFHSEDKPQGLSRLGPDNKVVTPVMVHVMCGGREEVAAPLQAFARELYHDNEALISESLSMNAQGVTVYDRGRLVEPAAAALLRAGVLPKGNLTIDATRGMSRLQFADTRGDMPHAPFVKEWRSKTKNKMASMGDEGIAAYVADGCVMLQQSTLHTDKNKKTPRESGHVEVAAAAADGGDGSDEEDEDDHEEVDGPEHDDNDDDTTLPAGARIFRAIICVSGTHEFILKVPVINGDKMHTRGEFQVQAVILGPGDMVVLEGDAGTDLQHVVFSHENVHAPPAIFAAVDFVVSGFAAEAGASAGTGNEAIAAWRTSSCACPPPASPAAMEVEGVQWEWKTGQVSNRYLRGLKGGKASARNIKAYLELPNDEARAAAYTRAVAKRDKYGEDADYTNAEAGALVVAGGRETKLSNITETLVELGFPQADAVAMAPSFWFVSLEKDLHDQMEAATAALAEVKAAEAEAEGEAEGEAIAAARARLEEAHKSLQAARKALVVAATAAGREAKLRKITHTLVTLGFPEADAVEAAPSFLFVSFKNEVHKEAVAAKAALAEVKAAEAEGEHKAIAEARARLEEAHKSLQAARKELWYDARARCGGYHGPWPSEEVLTKEQLAAREKAIRAEMSRRINTKTPTGENKMSQTKLGRDSKNPEQRARDLKCREKARQRAAAVVANFSLDKLRADIPLGGGRKQRGVRSYDAYDLVSLLAHKGGSTRMIPIQKLQQKVLMLYS